MAIKKPLVYNETTGLIERLQSGDSISEADFLTATNANAGAIVIGTPVYVSAAGAVDKSRANAIGTSRCIGLVADTSVANGASANIQANGALVATTGEWDSVTGGSGGLTAGSLYFVSEATAGLLRTTAPATGFSTKVGYALSTTTLIIDPELPIQL